MSLGPSWERLFGASPIFARELRQAQRTGRVILLILVMAVLLGLIMLGISSALGMSRGIQAGPILFQVFFSLVYFAVSILGPTLAATGLSSEKERRTWEALRLTGMDPRAVTQGKFWTALSVVLLFLAVVAPASLLCMWSGGVGFAEIAVAFVLLAVIAVVGVAFGLSVGAWAESTASATLVALASSLVGAPILYVGVGVGFSFLAHTTWAALPAGLPVWLPLAYVRAHFDGWYVLLLLLLPTAVAVLATWFCFEVTQQRLASESDDRTRGLKIWYLVSTPWVSAIAAVPGIMTRGPNRPVAWMGGLGGLFLFLVFCAFVFSGDALEPPRRVEFRWHKAGASWMTKMLGPGLVQTCLLTLVVSLLSLGLFSLVGALTLSSESPHHLPPAAAVGLLTCGEYWSSFLVFVTGFLMWARLRANSASAGRVLALLVTAIALAAPWIVFLVFGYGVSKRLDSLILAAPSPLYAFVMVNAIERGEPHVSLTAGLACSLGWVSMGLTLFGLGASRATKTVAERRTVRAALDNLIASEEARDALGRTSV